MKKWLAVFLFSFSFTALADTEIITPNSTLADDLLPTVQKLLEPGGSVSVFQGKLIIKSSAQNIADIKNVLQNIDKPAKQLLITVRQGSVGTETDKGYRVDGKIQVNPNVTITHNSGGSLPRNSNDTKVSVGSVDMRVNNDKTSYQSDNEQRISAAEGYPAHILIGQQVPITTYEHDYGDRRVYRNTDYEDVNQGFYVTARIVGDNLVQVDISTENDRVSNKQRDVIDTQHAATTMTGKLGQWLAVGGINQQGGLTQGGYLDKNNQTVQIDNTIYIKIEITE